MIGAILIVTIDGKNLDAGQINDDDLDQSTSNLI